MDDIDFRKKSKLGIFLSYFRPHRRLFVLDMVCALLVSMVDLAFPAVSRWCLYTLIPQGMWKVFWTVMIAVVVTYCVRALLYYVIWYWGHRFGIRVEADIRRDLFSHIQKLECGYFDKNRVGQLMSRLTTDLFEITELAHHAPEDIFISTVTITGALIVMFTIQWKLALVLALMIPVFLFIVLKFRRSMGKASADVKKTAAGINADFESALSGIRTAKAFANEAFELEKFDSANSRYKESKRGFHRAMGRFNSVMDLFLSLLSVTVISVGGALIMNGQLNVIDLVTFSLYITTFVTPIRRLATTSELIANGTAGLDRFVEIMRTEPEYSDRENAVELKDVRGNIEISQVDFSYNPGHEVLHGISLEIKAGETVAFVGASGSGKTTLSQLIPRMYEVSSGSVSIDGKDIRDVTMDSLRKNIGVVTQDVFLFADTIKNNIRYGKVDATDKEIEEAARLAEIYDDIMAMPDGFDSYAGERGVLLSGGQKQRISIARIFLKNPPVLILDEATSALDSVTEARIQKTFEKLSHGRTTIVIAHRLSTVKNADRIAVIENGRIVEVGTHAQLLEKKSRYSELVKAQELI